MVTNGDCVDVHDEDIGERLVVVSIDHAGSVKGHESTIVFVGVRATERESWE